MEIWKPVVGFEGLYDVSDHGHVRNARSGVLKKPTEDETALRCNVLLWKANKASMHKVHRLVLFAFVGTPPDGHECCHNDGDFRHNHIDNLRWGTSKENKADRTRHGTDNRGERCGTSKLTTEQVLAIRADCRLHREIAAEYNIRDSQVSRIKNKVRWAHV